MRVYMLLLSGSMIALQTVQRAEPLPPLAAARPLLQTAEQGDGRRDFDFEIGTWNTKLSRLAKPMSGSSTWVEYTGTTTVRKVWDGRANLVELDVKGPSGRIEGLSLSRRVLRSGDVHRPDDLRALRDLGHHADVVPFRAGVFGRRGEDVGSELDRGGHAGDT